MKRFIAGFAFALMLVASMGADSCSTDPTSAGGVTQITANVPKGPDGLTIEQRNVRDRLVTDNKPGSIKHLYVISAYSGQVLMYSTVRGKVTSSGKRLQPSRVESLRDGSTSSGFATAWHGLTTAEVLGDDGTYGTSVEYLYWWDANGVYHQQYVTGGMILHISDQPLSVKGVVINMAIEGGTGK